MRAELAIKLTTAPQTIIIFEVELGAEETILQTDIKIVADRGPKAGNGLPRNPAILAAEAAAKCINVRPHLQPVHTDTAARTRRARVVP